MVCEARVDGGWGWIIVTGFALTNLCLAGIFRAFGIFFTALVEEFHGSASLTAFAFGLFLCMFTVSAPITVYLGDRFSERLIVMIGSCILGFSLALIFLAPNLVYVIVFIGITGIGHACVGPCYLAAVGKYFKQRSSMASTLGFAGASVGQIVIPHLILYLLREYGLRGMIMLYGGILLHIAIFGALIRPLAKVAHDSRVSSNDLIQQSLQENGNSNKITNIQLNSEAEPCLAGELTLDTKSDDVSVTYMKRTNPLIGPEDREIYHSPTSVGSLESTLASAASIISLPIVAPGHLKPFTIKAIFHKIFDLTLLKNLRFILFLVASGVAKAGFISQITYLVPWCIENEHSINSAALLLSIAGGTEVIGRIIMGFLADCKPIGPVKVMIFYTIIIGSGNLLMAFVNAYVGMIVYAVVFGLWGSGGHLLTVPIVCTFSERERVASAVGLTALVHGFSMAVVNSAMGLIKDSTGSFQGIFFTCASFQWLSSCLMIIALFLHRHRDRPTSDDTEISTDLRNSQKL